MPHARTDRSLLTDHDLYLFNEGSHYRLYEKLGAHPIVEEEERGTYFAVWAPNAIEVSVIGEFNGWDKAAHVLTPRANSGIWEGFVEGDHRGQSYKFHIASSINNYNVDKADPFAFSAEVPPKTASRVCDLNYAWGDDAWMSRRRNANSLHAPMSIYEVHLGSWMRVPEEGNRWLSYREIAPKLVEHVKHLSFTHIEFMPVMEHPFYGSWGYQVTGYFAPTSRYGTPQDFMTLVDTLHQNGIGVILDWVPSHFPTDEFGLGFFDGTKLFEHADPRQGYHPDWKSNIFNYGRREVRAFLISGALFWLDHYHVDGLRVDGVASMLYLDYSRKSGEWVANAHGGHENLEAISLLRRINTETFRNYPDTQTIAEESTSWPMVSRPAYLGGLGFGLKWDMGWMHDVLSYMAKDSIHRRYHHDRLTFRMLYAFNENFVMSLSHDEVVYGKGSLWSKMSGDDWQKFANLRLLFGTMFGMPGKKLLFMGDEFGQRREWNHDASLDWHLLNDPAHEGVRRWVADVARLYASESALHELDCDPSGFQWMDCNDALSSVLSFVRRGRSSGDLILVACNFTPVGRKNYRIGVPAGGFWRELLNSDAPEYGGSGVGNFGGFDAETIPAHNQPCSLNLTLPPLGAVFMKHSA
jgi:1,4-alpha-glucan branching enzyme